MGWINLIFLSIGLGVGWLASDLLRRSKTTNLLPVADEAQTPERQPPEKQALLEQLEKAQLAYRMATELSQFKSSFLARTSHELRSPLNGVISLHQLILSDLCESPDEEREFVAQAQAAALKMLARLDEVIHISKLEHGSSQLEIQPLQLAEVLEEVRRLTYLQAQNRNLRLDVQLPDPVIYVLADPRWLQQVLTSLVTTPIALMQEGSIRLSTQVIIDSRTVKILIEDQRPVVHKEPSELPVADSVTPTELEQLATLPPMPRSQNPLLPPSGLDLMINQTLMELMQGHLEVQTIPAADEPAPQGTVMNQVASLTQVCCSLPLVPPEVV